VPEAPVAPTEPAQAATVEPVPAPVGNVDVLPPPRKSTRRRALLIAGGAVGLVAIIAVVAIAASGTDTPEPVASASPSSAPPAKSTAAVTEPSKPPTASAPEPPKRTTALVKFACDPDCTLSCDGKTVESPGQGIELEPGDHPCVASQKGYLPLKRTVTAVAGEDQAVALTLKRAGGGGTAAPKKPAAKPTASRGTKPCNPFKPYF
jgi:hypothetical protein